MNFLEELASRRRFGIRPGLETIRELCGALGNPQRRFKAIHVAGTNGKGAVSAIIDTALRHAGLRVGRYTSPHLVRLNERFFLDGTPVDDTTLERLSSRVMEVMNDLGGDHAEVTFFEALTAVAFLLYAEHNVDYAVLECGLGGRLDATNVCEPELCVITRIGLDHCNWLGDTRELIAAEKAGIVKPGVPIVLGANDPSVRAVVEKIAAEVGAPFHYAPELIDASRIPDAFSLPGDFNRENAVTALGALKVLGIPAEGLDEVVWPGRCHRIGDIVIDGAHNPPAAEALASTLKSMGMARVSLVAGFCADKDVDTVLSILAPLVSRGFAVRIGNPRSLSAEDTAVRMRAAGIAAEPCASLHDAMERASPPTLICGSLFLAGEALVALNAYPWGAARFDAEEAPLGAS